MLRTSLIAGFAMVAMLTMAACGNSDKGAPAGGPQPRPVGFGHERGGWNHGDIDCMDLPEGCDAGEIDDGADLPNPGPAPQPQRPCQRNCPPCPNPTPAPPEGPLPPEEPPVNVPIPPPGVQTTVLFEFDSAVLTEHAKEKLTELLGQLDGFQDRAHLVIAAHADPIGTRGYNKALSKRRGIAVRDFLIEESHELFRVALDLSQFTVRAYGENDPVTRGCEGLPRNAEIPCRADDRRATVMVEIGAVSNDTLPYRP